MGGAITGGAGGTEAAASGSRALAGDGSGGTAAGRRAGTAGEPSGAPQACLDGDIRRPDGAAWKVDCNSCRCIDGEVLCTVLECAPATGGSPGGAGKSAAGAGGSSGVAHGGGQSGADAGVGGVVVGAAGAGGKPDEPPQCSYAEIGAFCVRGTPQTDNRVTLSAGMPLTVSLQPAGCYSSSCTKLVSSDCNTIGSEFFYQVSGFICLATEGEVCTDDCGGAPAVSCEAGVTLEEGVYTVGVGGTSLSVTFTVPSVVDAAELCAP